MDGNEILTFSDVKRRPTVKSIHVFCIQKLRKGWNANKSVPKLEAAALLAGRVLQRVKQRSCYQDRLDGWWWSRPS